MTDKNKRSSISKIALTNFQAFAERTEIPIEKITLMFGPNSAGKSAVEDALDIINMLRDSSVMHGANTISDTNALAIYSFDKSIIGRITRENSAFFNKLKSCWRKHGTPAKYTQSMKIEIETIDETEGWDGDGVFIGHLDSSKHIKTVCDSYILYIDDGDFDETLDSPDDIMFDYVLVIENEPMLVFNEGNLELALNCAHKSIPSLDFSKYFKNENAINELDLTMYPKYLKSTDLVAASYEDSVIKFCGIQGFNLRGQLRIDEFKNSILTPRLLHVLKNKNQYQDAFNEFSKHYQLMLSDVNRGRSFYCNIVNSSRKIPSKDDLFIYSKSCIDFTFLIESKLTGFMYHFPWISGNSKHFVDVFSKNNYASWLDN